MFLEIEEPAKGDAGNNGLVRFEEHEVAGAQGRQPNP
jgi:hypothetical protein